MIEVTIDFTDLTLIESEGKYDSVNELMKNDLINVDWTLESDVYIRNEFGLCQMTVQFNKNKTVVINAFSPSLKGETLYNPDIPIFSTWVQEQGWKTPIPHPDLVKDSVLFWKHFWETGLLNSDYLTKRFGKRDTD